MENDQKQIKPDVTKDPKITKCEIYWTSPTTLNTYIDGILVSTITTSPEEPDKLSVEYFNGYKNPMTNE